MFTRIMIANRGEIALRIIRACRELGIQAVLVFSEEDRDAPYLKYADESICIGPAAAAESYLNIARIIAAAEVSDVQAIHPGYGFLAENAHFAEICRSCHIEFIGPSAESMRMLGDKVGARKLAKKVRVPIIEGSDGPLEDEDEAVRIADRIGYPVILKAAAGGGGRGMRVARNDISLRGGFRAARSEAEAAFRNPSIYLEKFLERPRHVEVQVLADMDGNAVHLGERDCTLQRRHQKLVEESPCPVLDPTTRRALCSSAIRLVKAAGYHNAGTVEFLLDQDQSFYFIEANARIQVEHPVTEMVTGHDLVEWQLRIASGEKLDIKQRDIRFQGSSIECRINAEDPAAGFAPCPGPVTHFRPPGGLGVRVDSHMESGYGVSPRYDSLIGKLIVHKATRSQAIATAKRALSEFEISPIRTTIGFHEQIMAHPDFMESNIDTGWVERHFSS
jgi:acetyl-CoA carboxylase biotin carboxylase subunit